MRSERWCAASRASSSAIRFRAAASSADVDRLDVDRLEADRPDADRPDADRLVTIWLVGGCWALPTRGAPQNAAVRLRRTCRLFCAIAAFPSTLPERLSSVGTGRWTPPAN
jgi:hypothetical protein